MKEHFNYYYFIHNREEEESLSEEEKDLSKKIEGANTPKIAMEIEKCAKIITENLRIDQPGGTQEDLQIMYHILSVFLLDNTELIFNHKNINDLNARDILDVNACQFGFDEFENPFNKHETLSYTCDQVYYYYDDNLPENYNFDFKEYLTNRVLSIDNKKYNKNILGFKYKYDYNDEKIVGILMSSDINFIKYDDGSIGPKPSTFILNNILLITLLPESDIGHKKQKSRMYFNIEFPSGLKSEEIDEYKDALDYYIKEGFDINSNDYNGDSLLHNLHVEEKNWINIIEYLLNKKININLKNSIGMTILHKVIDKQEWLEGYTIHCELTIQYLCNLPNIDINIQDNEGNTPLIFACKYNNINIINILLEYNADIDIINKNGATALHVAVYYGNIEIIKLLLSKNPQSIIKIDNFGKVPKDYNDNEEIKKLFP